jgi:hypothetical protein
VTFESLYIRHCGGSLLTKEFAPRIAPAWENVRIVCSDRSGTTVSERPSAMSRLVHFSSSCFHCLFLDSTLVHRLPLKHRHKIPADESHSFPPSQPPPFPFPFPFIFIFSLFFHTLGNDDLHLAAARAAPVRPLFSPQPLFFQFY